MILSTLPSSDSGRTTFSRATDSGTSSMTDLGISTSSRFDELQVVKLGDGLHHLGLGGVVRLDQRLLQLDAGAGCQAFGFLELVGADGAISDEDVDEVAARFSHGSRLQFEDEYRNHSQCEQIGRPLRSRGGQLPLSHGGRAEEEGGFG